MWYKNSANKYKKIAFTIKIEIEAEGLWRPKSIGILTVLSAFLVQIWWF